MRLFLYLFWALSLIPKAVRQAVKALRRFLLEVVALFGIANSIRRRNRRRWRFHIGKPLRDEEITLPRPELERLLKRAKDLKDLDSLTGFGISFRLPERDFTVTRSQIEEILRRILEAHPPFLYLGRTLPDIERSLNAPRRVEKLWKRERRHVQGLTTLFIPEDRPIPRHSDFPPGNQNLRPARGIMEIRRASLLDQTLPPLLQIERFAHGDLLVTEYVRMEPHVEFIPRERMADYVEERETEVEVELETPDPEEKAQLVYFLLDTSASMKGMSATLAAAVFCAIHRANMGASARYYMRAFDDSVHPAWDQPPWIARTLQEREALYEKMFTLNFNGSSTHIGWALEAACRDIEGARSQDAELGKAVIVLITDGQSDLQPDTLALFLKTGAPLHTVMVARERNRDLERISDSFTTLTGLPEGVAEEDETVEAPAS
jgi:hypothetical protein